MKSNYTIGDLLLQGQDDYGISSRILREGILTAKKFNKIQHEEGMGDRMIWDFLLERMSVSPLIYNCYISKEEYNLLQKRKTLRNITDELRRLLQNPSMTQSESYRKLLKNGKVLLSDYSKAWKNTDASIQGSGHVHDLFVHVIHGWLLKAFLVQDEYLNQINFNTHSTTVLYNTYLAHLRKTWKAIHTVSVEEWIKNGHYFLAELELELIFLTADALLYNRQISTAKEILEWLCRPFLFACTQKRNKEGIRILPFAALKLAEIEFSNNHMPLAWNILEKAKRLMKQEHNVGATWLILNMQKHFISSSSEHSTVTQHKILNEYTEYESIITNFSINPYAIWEISIINNVQVSDDIIKNMRQKMNLTQHQLCADIIEPETYSRFESGKLRLRWDKQKLLLNRLYLPSERTKFIVDSSHPKVLVTAQNIINDIQLGRLDMANEKYIELSCWLPESSANNKFNKLITDKLDLAP